MKNFERRRVFEHGLGPELVGFFIALGARGVHAGAFGTIQHTELNGGGVGIKSHESAEGVDFPNHLTFGDAADGGIAGHLADGIEILSEQGDRTAETLGGEGGLDTGVTCSDDGHVEEGGVDKITHRAGKKQTFKGRKSGKLNYQIVLNFFYINSKNGFRCGWWARMISETPRSSQRRE